MTKAEFKHKYKDGIGVQMANFLKTLHTVMTSEEIDKVINWTKNRKEKRWLIKFKKTYVENYKDWDQPFWGTLIAIESAELLRDIIGIMALSDKAVYKGEHEED